MKLFHYLTFSAFSFLFFSCIKNSTVPIPVVDSGEYFTCKVNGNLWTPAGVVNPLGGLPLIWVNPTNDVNYIQISPRRDIYDNSGNRTTDEFINLRYVRLQANYIREINYDQPFFKAGCGLYIIDTTKSNFVKTIAVDTVKRMVKGVFQLECNSADCPQTIKITEGQFQVIY